MLNRGGVLSAVTYRSQAEAGTGQEVRHQGIGGPWGRVWKRAIAMGVSWGIRRVCVWCQPSGTSGTMALGEHCSPRCTCETVQITSNYNFSGKIETAFAGGEDDGSDGVTKVAALL